MAEFRHEGMIALSRADDEVDLLREVLRSLIEEHFGTPLEHITKDERVAWARIRGDGRIDRIDAVMRALEPITSAHHATAVSDRTQGQQ